MTGERELAMVERAEAYWLGDALPNSGRLMIVVRGTKPNPCYNIDIVPLQADSPAFAVVWYQNSDFCITKETPYSYSEAFASFQKPSEITLLCKQSDGKPEERRIPVERLEPNSLRALQGTSAQLSSLHNRPPDYFALMSTGRAFAGQPVSFPGATQPSPLLSGIPTGWSSPIEDRLNMASDSGSFNAQITFWFAGYGQCQITVDGDGRRWIFDGTGGGLPGGGAYSGKISTNSLKTLVLYTTSCVLAALTFYGTITFMNANAIVLGSFDGGGAGVGGGVYTGRWR